jgi:hypothetical protein
MTDYERLLKTVIDQIGIGKRMLRKAALVTTP